MSALHMTLASSASPETIRAALLDFSPDRPKVWPGITPDLYEVYDVGETTASIKEGTRLPVMGEFWARERYDWSSPDTISWTVEQSNFCAPGSYMKATIRPREGGGSTIELEWNRTPITTKAKVVSFMIRRTRGKLVSDSFKKALKGIEAS